MEFNIGSRVKVIDYKDSLQKKYYEQIGEVIPGDRRWITVMFIDGCVVYYTPELLTLYKPKENNMERVIPKKMKKRHLRVLKHMEAKGFSYEVEKYIESFKGKCSSFSQRVMGRTNSTVDPLAKPEHHLLGVVHDMYNTSRNHKPIFNGSGWTGVEIECFIPYDSIERDHSCECENCNGAGQFPDEEAECDCPTCEGRGNVDEEDGEGNTREVECSDCDGRGTIPDDEAYHDCDYCGGTGRISNEESAHDAIKRLIRDRRIPFTSVHGDGSINCNSKYFPIEIVILTRIYKPSNLEKLCALLKELGAKVNKSCGLHVHLDCRKYNEDQVRTLGRKFHHALGTMAKLVPKSRRDNNYCKLEVGRIDDERYKAVNLSAYKEHKTIEIRLHSGTTDFIKIRNWALLMHLILNSNLEVFPRTVKGLTERVGASQELTNYFEERAKLFSELYSSTEVNVEVMDQDNTDAEVA